MMQFFFNSVKTDVMFKAIFKSANKRPNISLQNCKISEGWDDWLFGYREKTHFSIGERHNFRGLESIFE